MKTVKTQARQYLLKFKTLIHVNLEDLFWGKQEVIIYSNLHSPNITVKVGEEDLSEYSEIFKIVSEKQYTCIFIQLSLTQIRKD